MAHLARIFAIGCLTFGLAVPFSAAPSTTGREARDNALRRLQAATGDAVVVSDHKATGAARFVRVQQGSSRRLGSGPAISASAKQQQSVAFFREYGALVGVTDANGLRLTSSASDALGETHLTWKQFHGNVPVFAGTIKTHFDRANELKAVTGTAVPDITVNTTPSWNREAAAQIARGSVVFDRGDSASLRTGTATLYIYREGLAQGVEGPNQLAWEIEVTDGAGIRELVYVDAHTGRVIDRVTAIHDQLQRRAFDGHSLPFVPNNYPNGAYWNEGDSFPTQSQEANNMIVSSKETYDLFKSFGRDSFDGKGATMDAIFDRGYSCPNASWNGTFISFCPGFTTDDVTTHEWAHAYTQYTHGLIYQWQPGALNESYSDIWGEVVDQINNRDGQTLSGQRNTGQCSSLSPPVVRLSVNTPATIAGDYFAQAATFGRTISAPITGEIVAALDAGTGAAALDGCSEIINRAAVAGKIALVDRGACEFGTKALNAERAGAAAVIVADNAAFGLILMGPGVEGGAVTIPVISVQRSTGLTLRQELAGGAVNATIHAKQGTDQTARWLMGEDIPDGGALRDMWNPACYSNPGKVTDPFYWCAAGDNGGVHLNSGVPNHAFALLVDGGTYNGRAIEAIGLTKASHIYYRAQTTYQVEDSDFADHADALEMSCVDLIGQTLSALTGGSSAQVITAGDCAEVADVIAAVELRTPPSFCAFPTLLNPADAPACSASTTIGGALAIASYDFESDPMSSWSATHSTVSSAFTPRDWTWVSSLPSGRAGSGLFAPSPKTGVCGTNGENGVLRLTSPEITLPAATSFARATFEHWFATEAGWDGGNLEVSVNGGPWQLVPPSQFTFNNYTFLLFTAAQGNSNPLAGQPAWTGANSGDLNGGSWARSHVNLGNFAGAGDKVRLRWNYGTDGCTGRVGWYLDNVNLFSCTPRVPAVSVADATAAEGNAAESQLIFVIRMSSATIKPVAVTYEVVDGTAQHGNDFDRVSGTVVIPASTATSAFTGTSVAVNIKGDIVPEGDETFTFRILGVTNATVGDGEAIGTIRDDDTRPGQP
jgi:Zn-dependent metalloprotease